MSSLAVQEQRHFVNTISRARDLAALLFKLAKIRITFFVGMSAVFGYVLSATDISAAMILPVLGIFLLSCSSAALNQYQERDTDSLMHRTRKRPLPSGTVAPRAVLFMVVALLIVGSALVFLAGNAMALVFSLLAFLSYNVIYTPLKKITPFAVVPGSFVGAFPVMAGWAAAGGFALDTRILAIACFFFIWQIPHFWLLMDLYSADYERGNFPTLRLYFNEKMLSVLTYLWIVILVLTSVFFITTRVVSNIPTQVAIAALGLWLLVGTCEMVSRSSDNRTEKSAFMKINVYVLAVTLVVMVDKVLSLPWRAF
jgi:protoheme IX farnesyltransferase